jgi:hypothetical protein
MNYLTHLTQYDLDWLKDTMPHLIAGKADRSYITQQFLNLNTTRAELALTKDALVKTRSLLAERIIEVHDLKATLAALKGEYGRTYALLAQAKAKLEKVEALVGKWRTRQACNPMSSAGRCATALHAVLNEGNTHYPEGD